MVGTGWSTRAAAASDGDNMQPLAESMLTDIDQATWITEGKSPHIIYIFFDPNCPFCHKLYESTRAWVKQGKAQLRWIPVGMLTPTSHGKAAAMLVAKDPLKAFYQNEESYRQGGGIDEDFATPVVEKQLKANEALLARTGTGAVPTLLLRTHKGAPLLVQGLPPKNKLGLLLEQVK
ncbi:MAG: thiol:disulfide interchange protein DsbG [Gammaproteobacteria bacterium]|nr:thiol:disulfide interchange protein DsbG [Gammaproteobacteria bacterium]